MRLPGRFEPQDAQRACAAAVSIALHAGFFLLIILSGGRQDGIDAGDTPVTQLVRIEAPNADREDGVDLPPLEPTIARPEVEEQLRAEPAPRASLPEDASIAELMDEALVAELVPPEIAPLADPIATTAITTTAVDLPAVFVMPEAERSALSQRLARLAEEAARSSHAQTTWEQDGRQYSATLILERANDGTALDRVIAEVSAADRGQRFTTLINLKRLAFSQYTQMVDRWDPMVQLHDDEIVGRFHSNSQFSMLYDSRTAPKFLGKVTTAARGFDTESIGRRRDSDIFRGGVETRAGRIPLPEELQPFEWAPEDENARVHQFTGDARIRFYADGGYTWRTPDSSTTGYVNEPTEHPVYFIAARGATLYVQGVLAGKVLIYSPHRIVVEGNLTYARDPRDAADSPDYLGLVCDRYIEVAPPSVTGPGDLEIQAAIFAGRRFVVSNINHRRAATLRIYGSLAAGSLSASEPRYAMRVLYDERFEQRRPPGFPSTNRFEVEGWNGRWTEASVERTADGAF